jgi:hypothetical protein
MRNNLSFLFGNLERWYDISYRLLAVPFTKKRVGIVLYWGDKKEVLFWDDKKEQQ